VRRQSLQRAQAERVAFPSVWLRMLSESLQQGHQDVQ
jgi:hypothetical protein